MSKQDNKVSGKIVCSSCGAQVEEKLAKCPYCDTMLWKGAQREYMEQLYQLQEEMDDLKEVPRETVKAEVKKQGRRIRKIILVVVVFVLLLAGLLIWESSRYTRDNKADYIWEQQHLPAMSALYEAGKMEELTDIFYDALTEDKPVWNWEYYDAFTKWLEEQENKESGDPQ